MKHANDNKNNEARRIFREYRTRDVYNSPH